MEAKFTVVGMLAYDPEVLDPIGKAAFPDEPAQQDALTKLIVNECYDLSLMYTDIDFFRMMVNAWVAQQAPVWAELKLTTGEIYRKYSPIENYDMYETEHKDGTINETNTGTRTGTGTNTHSVTGFNADTLRVESQDNGNSSEDASGTMDNAHEDDREMHRHGNIGVTMAQEMLAKQRDIVQFTLSKYIVEAFKAEFCVVVYN